MFERLALGSLVEKQQGGGTPPRNHPAFWHGDIPWASVKDFQDNQIELQATEETITSLGLRSSTSSLIPPGTPMVCTRMAVGRCSVSAAPTAINQDIRALYPRKGVNPRYLLRLLSSLQGKAESLSVGSTVKGIRSSDFLAIKAHIAPENEQGVIAHILDTLDTQIQKTEALIAKLVKVKEGLLHDLLTRGIDENGRLRPNPEQAPELYKESPLGLIPMEWEVDSLKSKGESGTPYLRTGPFGSSLKGEHWKKQGHPVITIGSLGQGHFIKEELLYVDNRDAQRLIDFQLSCGDVVFSRVADVGRSVVITENEDGWIMSSNLMRIRLDRKAVNPDFLQAQLGSFFIKNQIKRKVNSGGRDVANSEIIGQLFFSWPSQGEQIRICNRLNALSDTLGTRSQELRVLQQIKEALMDDLLTGRVRVTPLLDNAHNTTPA
ncbi:MAG: restriction endonuclease subunit S [Pseudomonadota bacterium]